jgi:hypothetical protein
VRAIVRESESKSGVDDEVEVEGRRRRAGRTSRVIVRTTHSS